MTMKGILAPALVLSAVSFVTADTLRLPVAAVKESADYQVKVYPGRVVPIARVDVIPQVSGEILEVLFRNGTMVREGDVLYRLDPVKYEAAVKNAESRLAECKANASYAELSYDRHKKLLESRAVSVDAVDNALSQRDSSRAAYAAAQAELVVAQDALAHCTIVAPIGGKVGSTGKTRGNYVTAGSEPLVSIVQNQPIRVMFSISNRDFLDLFGGTSYEMRESASIRLTLANGTELDENGEVEYVENTADELTDTMPVYVVFPNARRQLRPGGTVTVTLVSKRGMLRPSIPATAVLQDTQGPYVWVVGEKGAVERRAIARGNVERGVQFIEKGLRVGERVVADGAHKVTRKSVIEPAAEPTK